MGTIPEGARFRWRFTDDTLGDHWSEWHVNAEHCPGCCCSGPDDDGEHLEAAGYRDEDGFMDYGIHSRCNPQDPDEWVEVETAAQRSLPS